MISIELKNGQKVASLLATMDGGIVNRLLDGVQKKVLRFIQSQIMAALRSQGQGITLNKAKSRINKGKRGSGVSSFWIGTKEVPVIWYGKGKKSGSGRTIKNEFYKGAFFAKDQIYSRSGQARYPIEVVKDYDFSEKVESAWNKVSGRVEAYYSNQMSIALENWLGKLV